ncbi:MAG: transglycosylase SLT domain-containing protein [Pyrinomonadaceae bacterium]
MAQQAEAQVLKITDDAGRYFKQGLFHLQDNRRSEAREDFDKSVEVFLISGVDVQRNQTLRECYSQLIETVYRMEFANNQIPQIRSLSGTCGWNIDPKLADDIAKLSQSVPTNQTLADTTTIASVVGNQSNDAQNGFTEQTFEASPLDELAKLELNQEEVNIETPEAQQQYQLIRVAVANRSLGFSFQEHPMIQQFINYYRGRGRKTMEVGLYRSGMFMLMARRIFREEGVPENIAWLGQVESAWKPTAMSWAAASGLWQFIPGTGARFGLRRTAYVDERNSFEQATRASARYLKFLANRYNGNWELAMGAYNCGEGNVDRAIRRAGVSNFWAAYQYLPQETRNYVPNILATILIANLPNQYGFGHIRPAAPLRYDQIRVPGSTSLGLLAQASDTSVEYLRYLNPHLRTNMTPPEPYVINIPAGKSNEVVAVFKKYRGVKNDNSAGLTNSVKGETWENISNRTGISVAELKAANGDSPYPVGKVFVPMKNLVDRTSYSRPTNTTVAQNNVMIVKAQSGDTVETLAKRHGASPLEVAKFNGLYVTSKLNNGREIRIPTK